MRLCHSVIERVILSASDSLDHCTQVVKFQEDYMKIYFVSYYMLVSLVFSRINCKDIVICLVNECHCDPNARGNDGETPLHCACR